MMSCPNHNPPLVEDAALNHGSVFTASKRTLYVVATPLGNLRDITLRAIDILRSVDGILAEDTRVTAKLLSAYRIAVPMRALHQHNEKSAVAGVLAALREGKSLALVTDAGTPAISDPGAALVDAVSAAGFLVVPIPGACAVATAVSGAGLSAPHFYFAGFLPTQKKARHTLLQRLARQEDCALVFYEAPHRVKDTVAELAVFFEGARKLIIARELTKTFEQITRVALSEASGFIAAHPETERGELVLMVDAATNVETRRDDSEVLDDSMLKWIPALLEELPPARAARVAAAATGISRELIYREMISRQKTFLA